MDPGHIDPDQEGGRAIGSVMVPGLCCRNLE